MSHRQHKFDRDKKIADTNWGLKPDDQPANAAEAGPHATRVYRYDAAEPDVIRKILLAQRRGFNTANRARIERGRTVIVDINKDEFMIEGLGFGDENLITLLESLGAAFNPPRLREVKATEATVHEYDLSRAWAWGSERPSG